MGQLLSRLKNKNNDVQPKENNKQSEKNQIKEKQVEIQPAFQRKRVNINLHKEQYDPKPIFKEIPENKLLAVEKSPKIFQFINNQVWNVNHYIIRELCILNVFQLIKICNALALIIDGIPKIMVLLQYNQKIKQEQQIMYGTLKEQRNMEYKIYKDLFGLNFAQLKKLKLVQKINPLSSNIIILQSLQNIQMPSLQQLHVESFKICSIRFLKKCIWKNLSTLTLKKLQIYDTHQFASTLPYLASSQHLQNVNLQAASNQYWSQINWIIKLGFNNAFQQRQKLDTDDDYYFKYNNKVLRRIQFGLQNNKLARNHLSMISKKFNNTYFDNPISFW